MDNKIDWRRKLSSRKFWAALGAWLTSVLAAFNVADITIGQVSIIAAGIGALVVYILAEAATDSKSRVNEDEH